MRPSSPRRQRTPKVCINLTNCKYDLCEPSQPLLPRRWICAELAPRLVPYLCSAPFIATLVFPRGEHTYLSDMICTEAYVWCTVATVPCCAVPKVCAQLGWLQADHADEWDVFWSDQSISLARAVAMQPMQVLSAQNCAEYRWICLDLA